MIWHIDIPPSSERFVLFTVIYLYWDYASIAVL